MPTSTLAPHGAATSGKNHLASGAVNVRPSVKGKFIFVGGEKLYIRGVTYGTFRPDEHENEYHPEQVERDFRQIAENGLNSVRTYTVPPRWLLDTAQKYGLYVMVGLPWEQHITFLDDDERVESIKNRVREGVRSCANHPAILCYTIGNEIPSAIVRWHGARKIENFLKVLYGIAKEEDPGGLVSYVSYPSTEYLQLAFVDFFSFNVYLESEENLSKYLARLQNIAGDVPVVLAEIGLDSQRNGEEKQADTLAWQISAAFRSGCAGAFIFSWTDEWHRGGHDIEDWDFGLTTRERDPKPALAAVTKSFGKSPFPRDVSYPRISVVVCSYNGGLVIRDCLEGLLELDYPDFEVIVVDDGSQDNTADIVSQYPFRLIQTENRGLSNARNTGLNAATGEIVAYTDDDARPDPHWLYYLAQTFMTTHHVGVGGPNIAPPGDGWIAECVANAPGGPVHVLLDDEIAEHIPGCNCSFRTEALRQIGGWDPKFRTAGDDVDVCWRLQQMGWTIGFNPAAMVWHHRRNSIRTYWKQQIGYGRAESLLEEKWTEKYNAAGHLAWSGRLYGKGLTQTIISFYERIYHGRWGMAPFQSVYERTPNSLWSLPLMPEWYLVIGLFLMLSVLGIFWQPILLVGLVLSAVSVGMVLAQAIMSAAKASFTGSPKTGAELLRAYAVTTLLHVLQPLARLAGRIRYGLTPWRRRGSPHSTFPVPRTKSVWSEKWHAPEEVLTMMDGLLKEDGAVVDYGGDFDRWDIDVRGGILASARVLMTVEEHGAGKQLFRFKIYPKVAAKWPLVLLLLIALAAQAGLDFFFLGGTVLIAALCLTATALLLSSLIYRESAEPFAAILGSLEALGKILNQDESSKDEKSIETTLAPETKSNGHKADSIRETKSRKSVKKAPAVSSTNGSKVKPGNFPSLIKPL